MRRAFRVVAISGMIVVSTAMSGHSQEENLRFLEGPWVLSLGSAAGGPVFFRKMFIGYEADIPWWGHTTVHQSGGTWGDHIQVTGSGFTCYYYVSAVGNKKMIWNMTWWLRHAVFGNCPQTASFQRSR